MEATEEVAADEGGDEDVEVLEVVAAVVGVVEDAADPGGKLTFPQLTQSKRRFRLLKGIFASPPPQESSLCGSLFYRAD